MKKNYCSLLLQRSSSFFGGVSSAQADEYLRVGMGGCLCTFQLDAGR